MFALGLSWVRSVLGGKSVVATVLAVVAGAIALGGAALLAVDAHDDRIAADATEKCEASQALQAADARMNALREDNRAMQMTLLARANALSQFEISNASLAKELLDGRSESPSPDTVVIPDGDPWLRKRARAQTDRAAGGRPGGQPLPGAFAEPRR
jgi:hypothetical protein